MIKTLGAGQSKNVRFWSIGSVGRCGYLSRPSRFAVASQALTAAANDYSLALCIHHQMTAKAMDDANHSSRQSVTLITPAPQLAAAGDG